MDPALLFSVISSQSGTPGKALLEGIMNSIDAGATQVIIDVNDDGFTVSDDGAGFESKQTIIDFFGTFGKPHSEGDATYGKYRMGRGQMMSFGANVWRSGAFRMEVDIKNKGLDYVLTEAPSSDFVNGCEVKVVWYDKIMPSEIDAIHREFKEMAAYAQIPVIYNGKQINKLPQNEKWDLITDEAYIKTRETGGMATYNLGVLVRVYGNHQFGTGGIIVSRKQLQVNFARNEILLNKCETWKAITKTVKSMTVKAITSKKTRITDDERIALGRMLLSGELPPGDTVREAKLIKNAKGSYSTLDKLLQLAYSVGNIISFAEGGNQVAEMIHSRGLAFVIAESTFRNFDANSPDDFFDAIDRIAELRVAELNAENPKYAQYNSRPLEYSKKLRAAYVLFDTLKSQVLDSHTLVDEADLDAKEKAVLSALRGLSYAIPRMAEFNDLGVEARKLQVGASEVSEAWTDGRAYIAIRRDLLKEVSTEGYKGLMRVSGILVHEYLHSSLTTGSHIHDLEFFEQWHDIMLSSEYLSIGRIVERSMLDLAKAFRAIDKAVPRNIMTALDVMAKTNTTPETSDNVVELKAA